MLSIVAIRQDISLESQNRFWLKVAKVKDGCWEWLASKNEAGYGIFGVGKDTDKAPRISWRLINGKIPTGLIICHKCDNPGCVNPDHLFLGTHKDNRQDAIKKVGT